MVRATAANVLGLSYMKMRIHLELVILSGLLACFGGACGKKAATDAAKPSNAGATGPVSASNLPGANDVLKALESKNYDGAIAVLLRVRQGVANPQQQVQFATLADEVKIVLLEAAPNSPKAAEALTALRRITGGR